MIIIGSSDNGARKYLESINFSSKYKIRKIYNLAQIKKLKHNIKKIKFIITGTSLGNSIDRKLVLFAKQKKIKSISVIEHWTNYRQRFKYRKLNIYPDYIFLNDKISLKKAIKEKLPINKLKIVGNPYLEKLSLNKFNQPLSSWAKKIKKKYKKIYLFVSEQIKNDKNLVGEYKVNEFDTLKMILKSIKSSDLLIIKSHPSENLSKFNKFKCSNVIVKKQFLYNDLINLPTKIVGIKSILLIELSFFRNDIISFRPRLDPNFFGEEMGIIKLVRKNLSKYLISRIVNKKLPKSYLSHSNERINKFLKLNHES